MKNIHIFDDTMKLIHLQSDPENWGMGYFFLIHGKWVGARDKHFASRFSGDFCSALIFIPQEPWNKTLIPYIYNAFNKKTFLKFSEKRYQFKILTVADT